MRLRRALAAGLASAALACAGAPASQAPPQKEVVAALAGEPGTPRTLVFVTIAGLTPSAYGGDAPAMPQLAALALAGVSAERVEGLPPAALLPVHATLATGVAPETHGITGDVRVERTGLVPREPGTLALGAPALYERVPTRAFGWPGVAGGDAPAPGSDARNAEAACAALATPDPPRLVLVHLAEPRLALERQGVRALGQALRAADAQLAKLVACSGAPERAAFAVAGDVAYAPVHSEVRPNALLARLGLVKVGSWRAIARTSGGSAFVYARDDKSALAAREALAAAAKETGAFRIASAQELLARGGDPEAWFGLEASPGYAFSASPASPLVSAAPVLAAGGYLETQGETPGFVAWGRGVRSGVIVPELSQLDVAPTLATLLGVGWPAEGRALVGLLAPADVAASGAPQ